MDAANLGHVHWEEVAKLIRPDDPRQRGKRSRGGAIPRRHGRKDQSHEDHEDAR